MNRPWDYLLVPLSSVDKLVENAFSSSCKVQLGASQSGVGHWVEFSKEASLVRAPHCRGPPQCDESLTEPMALFQVTGRA